MASNPAKRPLRVLTAQLIALSMVLQPVMAVAQPATNVMPVSGTPTVVTADGTTHSNVTGGKIVGDDIRLHRFSAFDVGAGDSVNMHFDKDTNHIVNLIDGGKRNEIWGTVNAVKGGNIGGHLYLFNPNGMLVGDSGLLNVGSLTLGVPTRKVFDDLAGASRLTIEKVNAGLFVNGDGRLEINGRIHVLDDINIYGSDLHIVGGQLRTSANFAEDADVAGGFVNLNGSVNANEIVLHDDDTISIVASSADSTPIGRSSAKSFIEVVADMTDDIPRQSELTAGRIDIQALATSSSDYVDDQVDMAELDKTAADAIGLAKTGLGVLAGLGVGYIDSQAESTVKLDGSQLRSKGSLSIQSKTSNLTKDSAITNGFSSWASGAVTAAAVVGNVTSNANIEVTSSGLNSKGEVKLSASTEQLLDIKATNWSKDQALSMAIAVGISDANSAVTLSNSVLINADSFVASTENVGRNSVQTTVKAASYDAKAAISVAVSHTESTASTSIGGNIKANRISISSKDKLTEHSTIAASSVGLGIGNKIVAKVGPLSEAATSKVAENLKGKSSSPIQSDPGAASAARFQVGGAVTIAYNSQTAKASLAERARVSGLELGAVANKFELSAITELRNRNTITSSGVDASKAATATQDATPYGGSLAVNVGTFMQQGDAKIKGAASLKADQVVVTSETLQPYDVEWSFTDNEITRSFIDNVAFAKDMIGVDDGSDKESLDTNASKTISPIKGLLTSAVRATAGAEKVALAGSINVISLDTKSTAAIGEDVIITSQHSDAGIRVKAQNTQEGIAVAGNVGATLFGVKTGEDGVGVGAVFNQISIDNNTRALIAKTAVLNARKVDVKAENNIWFLQLAPAAAKSQGSNFMGNASLLLGNMNTLAEFAATTADKRLNNLSVESVSDVNTMNIAGIVAKSASVGVGLTSAVTDLKVQTIASIKLEKQALDNTESECDKQKSLCAKVVSLLARSATDNKTVAFAATYTSSSDTPVVDTSGSTSKGFLSKIKSKLSSSTPNNSQPGYGIGVSGAVAYNILDIDTHAIFDGDSADADVEILTVDAKANNSVFTGAGGVSLVKAKAPSVSRSSALAGALTLNYLDNLASASVRNLKLIDNQSTKVKSVFEGDQISVGLGVGANGSSGSSRNGAASVSITRAGVDGDGPETHGASAELDNVTFENLTSKAPPEVGVYALNQAMLVTGGGALAIGGNTSAGLTVAYTESRAISRARISGSSFGRVGVLEAVALDATRLYTGALAGAAATKDAGVAVAGSGVGNQLANRSVVEVEDVTIGSAQSILFLAQDTESGAALDQQVTSTSASIYDDFRVTQLGGETGIIDDGANENNTVIQRKSNPVERGDRSFLGRFQEQGAGAGVLGVSGSFAGGKKAAAGASIAVNNIANHKEVRVNNLNVNEVSGNVILASRAAAQILGITVGAGGSKTTALFGSSTTNIIRNKTTVAVSNSNISALNVTVLAEDDSSMQTFSGQVAGSGKVAVGAAITVANIANDVSVSMDAVNIVTASHTDIRALNASDIDSLAAGVGVAKNASAGGSSVTSLIGNYTGVDVLNSHFDVGQLSEKWVSDGLLSIDGHDQSRIRSLAASVQIAGGPALAVANTNSRIANIVSSKIRADEPITLGENDTLLYKSFVKAGDVEIRAISRSKIETLSAGVGGAKDVAAAGSVVVNLMDNKVYTGVEKTGVFARGSVGILADSSDKIQSVSGALAVGLNAAGIGLSVAVNELAGHTIARVDGSNIHAEGIYSKGLNVVKSVANNVDSPEHFKALEDYGQRDLIVQRGHQELNGIAINSSSAQLLDSLSVSVGVGAKAAVGINSVTSIFSGHSVAAASGSTLQAGQYDSSDPAKDKIGDIDIRVTDHAVAGSFAGTLAASGGLSASPTVDVQIFERSNLALVDKKSVLVTTGAVSVEVDAVHEAASLVAVAAAAGKVALSLNGTGIKHAGSSKAIFDDSRAYVRVGRQMNVRANHKNFSAVTALAAGGSAGFTAGLSAMVVMHQQNVEALVRNQSVISGPGQLAVSAALLQHNLSAGGSVQLAGSASVAGLALVNMTQNSVKADINSSQIGSFESETPSILDVPMGKVSVSAQETLATEQLGVTGSAALNAAAGLVANIVLIDSDVVSTIANSRIKVADLSVSAKSAKEAKLQSAGVAVSGGAAVSGTVGVLLIGKASLDARDNDNNNVSVSGELDKGGNGSLSSVDGVFTQEEPNDHDENLTEVERERLAQSRQIKTRDQIVSTDQRSNVGVLASVDASSSILATGSTAVTALEMLGTENVTGAVSAGSVSVGGSVAVSETASTVNASFSQNPNNNTNQSVANLSVSARSEDLANRRLSNYFITDVLRAINTKALAGSAGFTSIGGAVAIAESNNQVKATLAGVTAGSRTIDSGIVNVNSADTMSGLADAGQAGLSSSTSVGLALALAERRSVSTTKVSNSSITGNSISISARRSGDFKAKAVGLNGGIMLGVGAAVASTKDSAEALVNVTATDISLFNKLSIATNLSVNVEAVSTGIVVSGVGLGASIAKVGVTANAATNLNATQIHDGGNVHVRADNGYTGVSKAIAGAGSLIASAAGADATTIVDNNANISISGGSISRVEGVTIDANKLNTLTADATGIAVSGLASAGLVHARTSAAGNATLAIGKLSKSLITGVTNTVKLTSRSNNIQITTAISGSGGLVSGSATLSKSSDTSDAILTIESDSELSFTGGRGQLVVVAKTDSTARNKLDATSIAGIGGSGIDSISEFKNRAEILIGGSAIIHANSVSLTAQTTVTKPDTDAPTLDSIGGGLANVFVLASKTKINNSSNIGVGDSAAITVAAGKLDKPSANFLAENRYNIYDHGQVSAGGAIQAADLEVELDIAEDTASITFGRNVVIDAAPTLSIAALTNAVVRLKARSKTWGLAAAASAKTDVRINSAHRIEFFANEESCAQGAEPNCSEIRSLEDIYVTAGKVYDPLDPFNDRLGKYDIHAESDVYNKTAFPITIYGARVNINQDNLISIGRHAQLRAVKDVNLATHIGSQNRLARATGADLWKEIASAVSGGAIKISGGSWNHVENSRLTIDGLVEAGIYHRQYLEIDDRYDFENYSNDSEALPPLIKKILKQTEGISLTRSTQKITEIETLEAKLEELEKLIIDYAESATLKTEFEAQRNLTQAQLKALRDGTSKSEKIHAITIAPVFAQPGDIFLEGRSVTGNGTLTAHGDATIEIINHGPAFLVVQGAIIPDALGGRILFNDKKFQALDGMIVNSNETAPAPLLKIHNTDKNNINFPSNSKLLYPRITVKGDVWNANGLLSLRTGAGDIVVDDGVDIRAKEVDIDSGGGVTLGFKSGIRHVGGDPAKDPYFDASSSYDIFYRSIEADYRPSAERRFKSQYESSFGSALSSFDYEKTREGQVFPVMIKTLKGIYGDDKSKWPTDEILDSFVEKQFIFSRLVRPSDDEKAKAYDDFRPKYDAYVTQLFKSKPVSASDWVIYPNTGSRNWSDFEALVKLSQLAENVKYDAPSEAGKMQKSAKDLYSKMLGYYKTLDNAASESGVYALGPIRIAGEYVNVHSVIQSGTDGWTLDLPKNLEKEIADNDFHDLILTERSGKEKTLGSIYNGRKNSIEINNSGGVVRGGFIEIVGKLISTGGGKLRAIDGYGDIIINNKTKYQVDIGRLNTGEGKTFGRGIEGVIRLVDAGKEAPTSSGRALVTEYRQGADGTLLVQSGSRSFDAKTGALAYKWSKESNPVGSYTPAEATYFWVNDSEGVTAKRLSYFADNSGLLDIDAFSEDVKAEWSAYSIDRSKDVTNLQNGEGVKTSSTTCGEVFCFSHERLKIGSARKLDRYSSTSGNFYTGKSTKTFILTEEKWKDVFSYELKADQPILVEFFGGNKADINIVSKLANVNLYDELRTETGRIKIEAKNIFQDGLGAIAYAESVELSANGDIGNESGLFKVGIGSGSLVAAGNNIFVHNKMGLNPKYQAGDLRIGNAKSSPGISTLDKKTNSIGGDVHVRADGTISSPIIGMAAIKADNVTIQAADNIGSPARALHIDSGQLGIVNALSSNKDIYLVEDEGNLTIGKIKSAGHVSLQVLNGGLRDGNFDDEEDTRTIKDLSILWADMSLINSAGSLGDVATKATDNYISVWVADREGLYAEYKSLSENIAEGVYRLSEQQKRAVLDSGALENDAALLEEGRYSRYETLQHLLQDDLTFFDINGNYNLTASGNKALLHEGSVWTKDELKTRLNIGVKKTSDTEIVKEDFNVVANSLNINVSGQDANIGDLTLSDIELDLSGSSLLEISEVQRAAILAAQPEDLIYDEKTKILKILRAEDLDFNVAGGVSVHGNGEVYLGSDQYNGSSGNLLVSEISGDLVRIKVEGKILAAPETNGIITTGNKLLLEASGGNIGEMERRLKVKSRTANPISLTMRASESVWLEAQSDLAVENIYSPMAVDLLVGGHLIDARGDESADIAVGSLRVLASGRIGLGDDPLDIEIDQLAGIDQAGVFDLKGRSGVSISLSQSPAARSWLSAKTTEGGTFELLNGSAVDKNGRVNPFAALKTPSDLHLFSNGDVAILGANVPHNLSVESRGDLSFENVRVGKTFKYSGPDNSAISGGNLYVQDDFELFAGSIDINELFAKGSLGLAATDFIAVKTLDVAADASIFAGSNLFINHGEIGRDLAIQVGGEFEFGELNVGNLLSYNGIALGLIRGGQLTVDKSFGLSASEINIERIVAGDSLALSATGSIIVNDAKVRGALTIASGENLRGRSISAGKSLVVNALNGIEFAKIDTGQDTFLFADAISLGSISSKNISLKATSILQVDGLYSSGDMNASAENITLGSVRIGEAGFIKASKLVDIESISTGAGVDIAITGLDARDVTKVNVQSLITPTTSITGASYVNIGYANIEQSLTVESQWQTLRNVGNTVGDSIDITLSGIMAKAADQIDLSLQSGEIFVHKLHTKRASILTRYENISFVDAVVNVLRVNSSSGSLLINNNSPRAVENVDVQLQLQNSPINLSLLNGQIKTNAGVIKFDRQRHDISGRAGSSESFVERNLWIHSRTRKDYLPILNAHFLPTSYTSSRFENWILQNSPMISLVNIEQTSAILPPI
jgi:filamentous hemagglutinin family protein